MLTVNFKSQDITFNNQNFGNKISGEILFYLLWARHIRKGYNGVEKYILQRDIWGDESDIHNERLKKRVYELNQAYGKPILHVNIDTISINPDVSIICDLNTLDHHAGILENFSPGTDAFNTHSLYMRQNLPMKILPNLNKIWIRLARIRFDEFQIVQLINLADHYIRTQQYFTAILTYESVLEIDPMCERSVRPLMVAYYQTRGITKAKALYDDLCKRLMDAYSITPSDQTVAVFSYLLHSPSALQLQFSNFTSESVIK